MNREILNNIIDGHSWIKVKGSDSEETSVSTEHHIQETEFLIAKTRELAAKLIEVIDHTVSKGYKASSQKRFAMHPEFYEGKIAAYNELIDLINTTPVEVKEGNK